MEGGQSDTGVCTSHLDGATQCCYRIDVSSSGVAIAVVSFETQCPVVAVAGYVSGSVIACAQ